MKSFRRLASLLIGSACLWALLLKGTAAQTVAAQTGEPAVEPPITAIAFSPQGDAVLTASQTGVFIRHWPSLAVRSQLPSKVPQVHDLAFTADGKRLAVVGGEPGETGVVEVWDWPSSKVLRTVEVGDDVAFAARWMGSFELVAGCSGNHLSIVKIANGSVERIEGHSKSVFAVDVLPKAAGILSGGADRSLRWWIREGGEFRKEPRKTLNNHTGEVIAIAVRPGQSRIPMAASAGKDATVRLWQPTIGRLVRFVRLPSRPLAIAWTPDGLRLGASCVDGRLRVIEPDTVEVLLETPATNSWAYSLAASPDSRAFLVGGADGQLKRIELPPLPDP